MIASEALESTAIVGAAGSGKTTELRARIENARRSGYANPLVAGVDEPGSHRLHLLARETLALAGQEIRLIDDVDAQSLFANAAAPLLAMEDEFLQLQIDPEVPGLRSPERFLESAFRLSRRLTEGLVSWKTFLERSLAGATEFYAHPPNLARPELIAATKDAHRNSLAASPHELQRQYRREIDLVKMLAEIFRAYESSARGGRTLSGRDAVAWAVERLSADAALANLLRDRYGVAFVDDAQDLTLGELALLRGVFGERLAGVTLAGDPAAQSRATELHVLNRVPEKVRLRERHRETPRARVLRPPSQRDESAAISEYVASLLQSGVKPNEIAVVLRSVDAASLYERGLLERDIPARILGDYNIFADNRALDALALLWNVHDPFRHDYLLRTLSSSAMGLSDASVAVLCGEPTEEQTVLFEEEPLRPPSGARHHDPMRGVRLARNVLEGERDAVLSERARERIRRFRTMRNDWISKQSSLDFESFVRLVWSEGLAREGTPESAKARAQQFVLSRLLDRLVAFRELHPDATLGEILADAERRAESDFETCPYLDADGTVSILSVECARGRSFDHVVVANVRPGAFPRWYAADALHFSWKIGVVPRDNVGDAPAARTAKFSYYFYRVKAGERFFARERRLFEYACSRARRSLLVTAWGKPTRALTAPEFLEELR